MSAAAEDASHDTNGLAPTPGHRRLRAQVFLVAVLLAPLGGLLSWLVLRGRKDSALRRLAIESLIVTVFAWFILSLPTCAVFYGLLAFGR
jgi:hypothetical protein